MGSNGCEVLKYESRMHSVVYNEAAVGSKSCKIFSLSRFCVRIIHNDFVLKHVSNSHFSLVVFAVSRRWISIIEKGQGISKIGSSVHESIKLCVITWCLQLDAY